MGKRRRTTTKIRGIKKMTDKLREYLTQYIEQTAILNHLRKYGAGIDEMNVIIGEIETLKIKIIEELK